MSAALYLTELDQRGVVLLAEGDTLRVRARPGVLRPDDRGRIAAQKPELLALLTQREAVLLVDFETRSLANLRGIGGRAYAAHETTETLCAVFRLPDGTYLGWCPGGPLPEAVAELVNSGVAVVAHGADGFDRHVWTRLGWREPARWVDTVTLARMAGFPERGRSLDALARTLLGREKDSEGARLTLALSRSGRKRRELPAVAPATLARVVSYCRDDVELLAGLYAHLAEHDRVERDLRDLDRRINDRGLLLDAELARAVVECDERCVSEALELAGVTADILRSSAKMTHALAERGVSVPNVQKGTLARSLAEQISPAARHLIDARLAATPIAAKKLRSALRKAGADGRIRDTLVYCAAHTGRWGGRGVQPQNLPRVAGQLDLDSAIEAALSRNVSVLRELAADARVSIQAVFGSLVRPCLVAPAAKLLGVVDYSQIEARALAWLAGDVEALEGFATGRDPYRALAAKLFGVTPEAVTDAQRRLGKVAELGCGYGMGAGRFHDQAAENGVDWGTVPLTPVAVVEGWRDAHAATAGYGVDETDDRVFRHGGLWQRLEQAARRAADGARSDVGALRWSRAGDSVVCELPSGRRMTYRNARLEAEPGRKRAQLVYTNMQGQRARTYGGLLAENVTQAVCRDILAETLLRLERAGFHVVLHVHDEVVAELDDEAELERMRGLMLVAPQWAAQLPLAAEAYSGARYQ